MKYLNRPFLIEKQILTITSQDICSGSPPIFGTVAPT